MAVPLYTLFYGITDYTYYDNGNLAKDFNKDIGSISGGIAYNYNELNLAYLVNIYNADKR